MTRHLLLGAAFLTSCAHGVPVAAPAPCPPSPGPDRLRASVFIDARRVADAVPVVLTAADPETYDFVGDPPPAVRDLPVARIDLIQFVSGDAARLEHGACPGMVAVLITTRHGR